MTSDKKELINNFKVNLSKKDKSIAIVGLGYVGLPLALTFAEKSFSVIGIDIDKQKVTKLKNKESYLRHINKSRITEVIQNNKFQPTSDFSDNIFGA